MYSLHLISILLCFQECRPVLKLCAGNNLVSKENACPDINVEILSNVFNLCLNITFDPMISFITFQLIISNVSNNLPIGDYHGHDGYIYYKMTGDVVAYVIIKVLVHRNKRSYNTMIREIQQRLTINVFAEINNQKFRVVQRIADYCDFDINFSNRSLSVPEAITILSMSGKQHVLESIVDIAEFFVERRRIKGGIRSNPLITKLSFCRQVELTKHEATVIEDLVLYVNLTGRLLFDFVATRDVLTAEVRVRVCLEDFPYDELRMSSGSSNWLAFSFLAEVLLSTLALSL